MTLSRKRPLPSHAWPQGIDAGPPQTCETCQAEWAEGYEDPPKWKCRRSELQSSGSALQRSGGGLKRTPIRSVSDRKDEKRPDLGTPLQTYVESLPCLLADEPTHRCRGDVVAHHVRHKAHAGDWTERGGETVGNLVPVCDRVHREIHTQGRRTFEEQRGVDLAEDARVIGEAFRGTEGSSG